ncbi:isoamyl alcohol [Fusarium albosuccineum]|uniref:Isoamyl alcohol n=1 Tax=Fusarium albosuccineum TaxID=1237068 RepID=A0A8H4KYY4_9HYPO|nr:isoamyl alcohol [Fusarium albosuccineum]
MKLVGIALVGLHAVAQLASAARLPTRQEASAKSPTILKPLPHSEVAFAKIQSDQDETSSLGSDISLDYGADDIKASLNVALKQPAVVLEDLSGLGSVKCSDSEIAITFTEAADFKAATASWPTSDFVIVTFESDGACNEPDERGFYTVSSEDIDEDALTIRAQVKASSLSEQAKSATISFETGLTPSKRDISADLTVDLAGTLADTEYFKLAAEQALFKSAIRLQGRLDLDILAGKANAVELDVDYSAQVNLNLSATVTGDYSTDLFNYKPLDVSVSAFSIPGIIDVGPRAEFGLGIEFGASGTVQVTLDVDGGIESGKVHLDLLDSEKTTTSGWTPSFDVVSDIDALFTLQLNPFIELTLAVGIQAFGGILDLSAGFDVQPKIINAFSANADFSLDSSSGITFNPPAEGQCTNAAWFASTFDMDIDAFISPFYRTTLFEVNQPIYKSQCWNFVE